MKNELKWIGIVIYWLLLVGVAAPALVSAPHTELVVIGFAWLIASAYATYRMVRAALAPKTNSKEVTTHEDV